MIKPPPLPIVRMPPRITCGRVPKQLDKSPESESESESEGGTDKDKRALGYCCC
jgi:hypothetical protein